MFEKLDIVAVKCVVAGAAHRHESCVWSVFVEQVDANWCRCWSCSMELLCLCFRQLTCWRDCLTFSVSLCPSALIYTSLRETSRGAATLALGVLYHAQRRACLSLVTRLALLGQLVTFISG